MHEGHGCGDLAPLGAFDLRLEKRQGRDFELERRLHAPLRKVAAKRGAALLQVVMLGTTFCKFYEWQLLEITVGYRHLEAVAKPLEMLLAILFC